MPVPPVPFPWWNGTRVSVTPDFIMLRLYALLIDIRGIARSVRVIDLAEELTYQCETMLWVIFVGATGVGPKV